MTFHSRRSGQKNFFVVCCLCQTPEETPKKSDPEEMVSPPVIPQNVISQAPRPVSTYEPEHDQDLEDILRTEIEEDFQDEIRALNSQVEAIQASNVSQRAQYENEISV